MAPDGSNDMTYPSQPLRLNVWEGTCAMELSGDGIIHVSTGTGDWWGCALEIQGDDGGEDLTPYNPGRMHFEARGDPGASFDIGFQTGRFLTGNQTNNHVTFAPGGKYRLTREWTSYSIPVVEMNKGAELADVTSVMFLRGGHGAQSHTIDIRNVYFSRE
jgi:hypothetical protein